jgi:4,5-dihydroxyphthalate decarboxylase
MADEIEVQVTNMRYDITIPFCDGRVPVDGVKLVPGKSVGGGTAFGADSPLASGDFGITDYNIGNLLPAVEMGYEVVALPVFSKRKPVYTYVFTRTDAGINTPKDLEGKRVWSSLTGSAIGIWLKGLLKHRYDVDLDAITWVVNRDPYPIYKEWPSVERFEGRKGIVEVLVDGVADAVMTDISDGKAFDTLENDSRFKRLWPNYIDEDLKLYKETGIYTPVHCVAMSRKLDREHPDLAAKLYDAFEKSKQIAYDDILNDRAGFSVVNLRERFVEQTRVWGDPFKHGMSANQGTIDTFFEYNYEFGIVKDRYSYEQVFASSTLDT